MDMAMGLIVVASGGAIAALVFARRGDPAPAPTKTSGDSRARQALDAVAAFTAAQILIRKTDYSAALRKLDLAIELGLRDAPTLASHAICLDAEGYHFDAVEQMTEAIRLDPRESTYRFQRANMYSSLGLYDLAIDDYRSALDSLKTDPTRGTGINVPAQMQDVQDLERVYRASLDFTLQHARTEAQLADLARAAGRAPRETEAARMARVTPRRSGSS